MNEGAKAVIAAISRERGIEKTMIFKRSVNVSRFKVFLEELRAAWPFDNMLLCMDNLSLHHNVEVRERECMSLVSGFASLQDIHLPITA